jgi:CheY-like chemotaxis protein
MIPPSTLFSLISGGIAVLIFSLCSLFNSPLEMLCSISSSFTRQRFLLFMLALFVDDDAHMRSLFQMQCKRIENLRTLTARNGKEALDVLTTQTPDLILSDLNMHVMNGFVFWEHLRAEQKTRTIPFILITSDVMRNGNSAKSHEQIENIRKDPNARVLGKDNLRQNTLVEIIEAARPK